MKARAHLTEVTYVIEERSQRRIMSASSECFTMAWCSYVVVLATGRPDDLWSLQKRERKRKRKRSEHNGSNANDVL